MTEPPDAHNASLMRNAQTIMLALIIAALMWASTTLVALDKRGAVMEEALIGIKSAQSQAYSRSSAERDYADVRGRVDKLEGRVDKIDEIGTSALRRAPNNRK